MYVYYNKEGKLKTIIPHGAPVRQGDDLDLYVCFDADYFDDKPYIDWVLNVDLILPNGNRGTTNAVPVDYPASPEVFHKTHDSEITYDLVEGRSYWTYHFHFEPEQATIFAGKLIGNAHSHRVVATPVTEIPVTIKFLTQSVVEDEVGRRQIEIVDTEYQDDIKSGYILKAQNGDEARVEIEDDEYYIVYQRDSIFDLTAVNNTISVTPTLVETIVTNYQGNIDIYVETTFGYSQLIVDESSLHYDNLLAQINYLATLIQRGTSIYATTTELSTNLDYTVSFDNVHNPNNKRFLRGDLLIDKNGIVAKVYSINTETRTLGVNYYTSLAGTRTFSSVIDEQAPETFSGTISNIWISSAIAPKVGDQIMLIYTQPNSKGQRTALGKINYVIQTGTANAYFVSANELFFLDGEKGLDGEQIYCGDISGTAPETIGDGTYYSNVEITSIRHNIAPVVGSFCVITFGSANTRGQKIALCSVYDDIEEYTDSWHAKIKAIKFLDGKDGLNGKDGASVYMGTTRANVPKDLSPEQYQDPVCFLVNPRGIEPTIGDVAIVRYDAKNKYGQQLALGRVFTLGVSIDEENTTWSATVRLTEFIDGRTPVFDTEDVTVKGETYKKLKIEDSKVQVQSAVEDSEGNVIKDTYARKDEIPETYHMPTIGRVGEADDETYAYTADFLDLDYAYGFERYEETVEQNISGCSSIKKGNLYGRNLDWLYNDKAEFVVKTPHFASRYATLGVALTQMTNLFVDSGEKSKDYLFIPFQIVDGINEKGLAVNTNVVPLDKVPAGKDVNDNINPDGTIKINAGMIPRYILDYAATADEAITLINQMNIVFSKGLHDKGYEAHFMVADKTKTYCVEFIANEIVVTDITGKPYMTNFFIDGVTFNQDGSVNTPASHASGKPTTKGITKYGSGLERYNLLNLGYQIVENKQNMRDLLTSLNYTKAYTASTTDVDNPYWYTEFVGNTQRFGDLTVDSNPSAFNDVITYAKGEYQTRDRLTPITWQTVHSVIYDLDNLTASVIFQEQDTEYTFKIDTYATEQYVDDAVAPKADKTYVDEKLAEVNAEIDKKADQEDVDEQFNDVADRLDGLDTSVGNLESSVESLDGRVTDIEGQIDDFATKEYVDDGLDTKQDKLTTSSEIDIAKVQGAEIVGGTISSTDGYLQNKNVKDIAFKEDLANKLNVKPWEAFGYLIDDSSHKISIDYLPTDILGQLEFKGVWDASSGEDQTEDESKKGDFYVAQVGGEYNPDGTDATDAYEAGDWALRTDDNWQRVPNVDAVTMVNGRIGEVEIFQGEYSSAKTYHKGDFVTSSGLVYLCVDETAPQSLAGNFILTGKTYSTATTSADGLMSSSDKSKLDGIEAGAEVNPEHYLKTAVVTDDKLVITDENGTEIEFQNDITSTATTLPQDAGIKFNDNVTHFEEFELTFVDLENPTLENLPYIDTVGEKQYVTAASCMSEGGANILALMLIKESQVSPSVDIGIAYVDAEIPGMIPSAGWYYTVEGTFTKTDTPSMVFQSLDTPDLQTFYNYVTHTGVGALSPAIYQYIKKAGDKVLTDAAIRDSEGYVIKDRYQVKGDYVGTVIITLDKTGGKVMSDQNAKDILDAIEAHKKIFINNSYLSINNTEVIIERFEPTSNERMAWISSMLPNTASMLSELPASLFTHYLIQENNNQYTVHEIQSTDSIGFNKTWSSVPEEILENIVRVEIVNGASVQKNYKIPADKLFWCTFGVTTYSAITSAVSAGKLPLCLYNNMLYIYKSNINSSITFGSTQSNTTIQGLGLTSGGSWSTISIETLNKIADKATTITSSSDDTKYATAKAVYDCVQAVKQQYIKEITVDSNGNLVYTNQADHAETIPIPAPVLITTEDTEVVDGLTVPKLTIEQLNNAYNAFVAGKTCIINSDTNHGKVIYASTSTDEPLIQIRYGEVDVVYEIDLIRLNKPTNVEITDITKLTFDEVENAEIYEVFAGGNSIGESEGEPL